ncbi:MAG: hypothetical protein JW797_07955 [Bradymonadales bacterium]|nr:hypothetical protein [Bradymonadales bacterium]
MALLWPATGEAFQIEGTGDFQISLTGSNLDDYAVLCLAGFDLVPGGRPGDLQLLLFAEFGPRDVISGSSERAGQIWIEIPTRLLRRGYPTLLSTASLTGPAQLVEWNREGIATFQGQVEMGWLEITADYEGDDLISIDLSCEITFTDTVRAENRSVEGLFFGGAVFDGVPTTRPLYPTTRRVTRVQHGCSGEYYTVVYEDPYAPYPYTYPVEQEQGCAGDDLSDDDEAYYYNDGDSSGCQGDTLDDDQAQDDGGCEGESSTGDDYYDDSSASCSDDDTSTGDGDEDSGDDLQCAGDDLEGETTAASICPLPTRPRSQRLVRTFLRNIHIWLPLMVILFWRRRLRAIERTARRES